MDKQTTVLHFLVETIEAKFPDLANFYDELDGITAAARGARTRLDSTRLDFRLLFTHFLFLFFLSVPMEALTTDVSALVAGMAEAEKELLASGPSAPQRLVVFIHEQQPRVAEVQHKAETARAIFAQTTEWFGEAQNKPSPEAFFSSIVKFVQQFKVLALLIKFSFFFSFKIHLAKKPLTLPFFRLLQAQKTGRFIATPSLNAPQSGIFPPNWNFLPT